MSNFWEKLCKPVPLYTEENVRDAIAYIDERQQLPFARVFKTALLYVQSQLTNSPFEGQENDIKFLDSASDAAAQMRDNAMLAGEFIAVVRWRYVTAALSDYRQYLILKEEAVI